MQEFRPLSTAGSDPLAHFAEAWREVGSRLDGLADACARFQDGQRPDLEGLVGRLRGEQAKLLQIVQQLPVGMAASGTFLETAILEQTVLARQLDSLLASTRRLDLARHQSVPATLPGRDGSQAPFPSSDAGDVQHDQAWGQGYNALAHYYEAARQRAPAPDARSPAPSSEPANRPDRHAAPRSARPADHSPFGLGFLSASVRRLGGASATLSILLAVSGIAVADRMFGSGSPSPATDVRSKAPAEFIDETARLARPEKASVDRLATSRGDIGAPPGERRLPRVGERLRATTPTYSGAGSDSLLPEERSGNLAAVSLASQADRGVNVPALVAGARKLRAEMPGVAPESDARMALAEATADAEVRPARPASALFVPVLLTHQDAASVRTTFAELQKTYRAVIGARRAEIQPVGGAGAWHRLVLLPASDKAAANDVCSRLRASGYERCWVKPY